MILLGNGHLRCAHVLEVLRPIVQRVGPANTIRSFEQHFDYVLENRGTEPITELMVLHQRSLAAEPILLNNSGTQAQEGGALPCTAIDQDNMLLGNTPFRTNPVPVEGGRVRVSLRLADGQSSAGLENEAEELVFREVDIEPAEFADLGVDPEVFARYAKLEGAVLPVRLRLKTPLRPFDPDDPNTRYFLRLHFDELAVEPVCDELMVSGSDRRVFSMLKQTFETWSPEFLTQRAIHRSWQLRDSGNDGKAVSDKLLNEWLLNPDRTVHIDDHRIALVTTPDCMLVDSVIRGGMTFWQRRRALDAAKESTAIKNSGPVRWLNIWTWGAAWSTSLDPAVTAQKVLEILKTFRGRDGRRNWYRIDVLLPILAAKIGTEIGWDSLVALLHALKETRLVQVNDEGEVERLPALVEQNGQRWRLGEHWLDEHMPEADDLYTEIRRALIVEQAKHTRPVRVFDERPFILLFGVCTVA